MKTSSAIFTDSMVMSSANGYTVNLNPHTNATLYTKVVDDIPNGRSPFSHQAQQQHDQSQQQHPKATQRSWNPNTTTTNNQEVSSNASDHRVSSEGVSSVPTTGDIPKQRGSSGNMTSATDYMNGQALGGSSASQSVNTAPGTSGATPSSALLAVPSMPSQNRFSSPPSFHHSQPQASQGSSSGGNMSGLRHRHTLQVPKQTQASRASGSSMSYAAQSDEIVGTSSGRLSPPLTAAPRRASFSIGRRPTRSLHSELHTEEIEQDEDSQKWAEIIRAKRASKRKRKEEEVEDEVLVGIKVDINHTNYVTMYNMLTGIRFVVSRCNAKIDRPLTDADFDAAHKFSFDIMGSELTPSAKYDFKFKDYAPWVFRHLRARFKLDPGDYLMSLTHRYILSELGSPGKSGSFFYFSRDYKYIIKTIHHGEHKFLRKILRDYYAHVTTYPNTLISQFFGLHRVKIPFGRKIHFVIMNNIFPPHKDIHSTYDLKGSTIGREYKGEDADGDTKAVLKDLNWIRRGMHLELGPSKEALFLRQAELDVELLKRLKIMDYSLLVGIHDMQRGNNDNLREKNLQVFQPGGPSSEEIASQNLARTPSKLENARKRAEMRKMINKEVPVSLEQSENRLPEDMDNARVDAGPRSVFNGDDYGFRATDENDQPGDVIYYLGIIDCLTKYTFVKRAEHFWKGLSSDKDGISAVPPESYGDRFFQFIKSIIRSSHSQENGSSSQEQAVNPVRGPSTDRGGPSSTVLPVVDEVGEGSSEPKST